MQFYFLDLELTKIMEIVQAEGGQKCSDKALTLRGKHTVQFTDDVS